MDVGIQDSRSLLSDFLLTPSFISSHVNAIGTSAVVDVLIRLTHTEFSMEMTSFLYCT